MTFRPKPGRIDGIPSKISAHFGLAAMSSGEVASLRGEITFTDCTSFGRMARAPLALLRERQEEGGE
eukprot:2869048-Lingulodinium_polyedra.AAC.1